MEGTASKTSLKISKCAQRRLNIQHELEENLRKQNHRSNLHSYKHREQLFNRQINHLKKGLEPIELQADGDDDDDEEHPLMSSNCIARIQNHLRSLNFSSETEKRLLCPTLASTKSSPIPKTLQKRNSNPMIRCVSFSPSRPTTSRPVCRSARNPQSETVGPKSLKSYLNQQIADEQEKQMKNNNRKTFLLKEFDELKYTIEDPYAAFSVLSALSRAFLSIDSATE